VPEAELQIVVAPTVSQRDDDPRRDTNVVHVERREAPLYRRDPAKRYAHPYYWAPFVLFGNWR
jgi:CHAT domain-containing protein